MLEPASRVTNAIGTVALEKGNKGSVANKRFCGTYKVILDTGRSNVTFVDCGSRRLRRSASICGDILKKVSLDPLPVIFRS